jgi:hypothetical protein
LLDALEWRRLLLSVPFPLAERSAALLEGLLPHPPLTRDQVRLLKTDKIVSGAEVTLADLGIAPSALEAFLPALKAKHSRSSRAR